MKLFKGYVNECRRGHRTFKVQTVDFNKRHGSIFEFTVCTYENQQFDYFFLKQIIIFINVLVSFTDAGKLLLNLISHNDTVAASPTGTLLKEKG